MKRCNKCGEYKRFLDFHNNPRHPGGLHRQCKECRKIETKLGYFRYQDKINKYSIKYNKKHKIRRTVINERYRCKMYGVEGNVSYDEWKSLLIRQNFLCNICNRKNKLDMDHIIPLSKGGKHINENIQALCEECNNKKGTRIYALDLGCSTALIKENLCSKKHGQM